jgi:hypothetical protein
MKLADIGQPNRQKTGNNWARSSGKRITSALPQHGGRLQVAMLAAQRNLEKKVQLVSYHPDYQKQHFTDIQRSAVSLLISRVYVLSVAKQS